MHNSIITYLLLRLYWNSMTIRIYLYQIITIIPWQYTVQIIVLAVHLNYETAHRYMKSNVKTNLRSMQVTQERTRHTATILENVQDNDSVSLIVFTCINSSTRCGNNSKSKLQRVDTTKQLNLTFDSMRRSWLQVLSITSFPRQKVLATNKPKR